MTRKLTNKNYIAIADWMLDLNLNTRELLTYALIYGFTQDSESGQYTASLSYLAQWLGIDDRAHATRYLKALVDKKLVSKVTVKTENKQKGCIYKTIIDKGSVLNNFDYDYIIIQPWMITELHLNGKDLLLYSLVHGYSRKGSDNAINYNKNYFAKWLDCRRDNVDRQVKKAIKKGLIKLEGCQMVAIVPKDIQSPQSGNTSKKVEEECHPQSGNTLPQSGNTSLLNLATNNLSPEYINNLNESVSAQNDFYIDEIQEPYSYFLSRETKNVKMTDEEMYSLLNKTQYKALNILIKKAMIGEIEATKESVILYFKKLVMRDWKDSSGNKIQNIVGYVQSRFNIKTRENEICERAIKEYEENEENYEEGVYGGLLKEAGW